MGRLRAANRLPVAALAFRAAEADGQDFEDLDAREFGHYLAMQALGHGVSWFDDHARFALIVPSMEYTYHPGQAQNGKMFHVKLLLGR